MKHPLLFLLLFALLPSVFAQTDSLKAVLRSATADTTRLRLFNKLSEVYGTSDYALARQYNDSALALTRQLADTGQMVAAMAYQAKIHVRYGAMDQASEVTQNALQLCKQWKGKDKNKVAQVYNMLGIVAVSSGNLEQAATFFIEAYQLRKTMQDSIGMAAARTNMGIMYSLSDKHEKAIRYYEEAAEIFRATGDQENLANAYTNMGKTYSSMENNILALKYFQLALNIREEREDEYGTMTAHAGIGDLYYNQEEPGQAQLYYEKSLSLAQKLDNIPFMAVSKERLGDIYVAKKDYAEARQFYQEALRLYEQMGDKYGKSSSLHNLGAVALYLEEESQAEQYLQEALAASRELKDSSSIANVMQVFGKLRYKQDRLTEAARYLEAGIAAGKASDNLKAVRGSAALLAKIAEQQGNYEKAYRNHVLFKEIYDSLFNKTKLRQLSQLEARYAYEAQADSLRYAQAQETAVLNASIRLRNIQLTALGIGLLAILAVVVLLYRQRQVKARANALLSAQKEEIRLQAEELQATNKKLIKLDRFKEQMTGMIVHDLKNPLNTVINYADRPSSTHTLPYIKAAGRRMLQLVLNMLDIQKFSDTEVRLKPEERNLSRLFTEATEEVQFAAEVKNIRFVTEPQHLAVRADPELTARVLMNLLSNAVKYSPQNSQIYLTAAKAENRNVKIAVRDEGTGIPEDQQQKVFERFGQADARKGSTGLGLTFCKLVVEAHGGQIGVDSEFGKGSTFWFTIPEGERQEELEKPVKAPQASPISLSQAEKTQLEPLLVQLREVEVYQASQIDGLLRDFDFSDSEGLSYWKAELDKAVFACNEEEYERLLNHSF